MKLPNKYKLENLSLLDETHLNYLHPDIVNYVLRDSQDSNITEVIDLDSGQKDVLIGVLLQVIREQKEKLEKIYNIVN